MSRGDRSRRKTNVPRPELARPAERRQDREQQHDQRPPVERGPIQAMPTWAWRTFPVFFAFALGLFVGVFVGVPSGIANEQGNGVPALIIFLGAAIILGFALSRITTRWLLARNWPKPRPRR
jgi:hypothetical protein